MEDSVTVLGNSDNYFTYSTVLLLGMAGTSAWNYFVCADGYFKYKLRTIRNETADLIKEEFELNSLQKQFQSNMATITSVIYLIVLLILIPFSKKITINQRIIPWSIVGIVCMILVIPLNIINTDNYQVLYFHLILGLAGLFSIQAAITQSGHFALSSSMPHSRYTAAMMSGQGLVAIFSSIFITVVTSIDFDLPLTNLTLTLFMLGIMLSSLILYLFLPNRKYIKFLLTNKILTLKEMTIKEEKEDESFLDNKIQIVTRKKLWKDELMDLWRIFWKIKVPGFSCLLVFCITLTIFPGLLTNLEAAHYHDNLWYNKLFIVVLSVAVFNLGDFLGRCSSHYVLWPKPHSNGLLFYTAIRILFIPFFLICKIQSKRSYIPVLIESEYIAAMGNFLLAFTNGHLGSILVIYGPQYCTTAKEKEVAGMFMCILLAIGLSIGSGFSLLITKLLE
ncbi:hypothetical protein SNEBB_010190 [Seison nebaliae]|nr:hypothetical protein SNEBB_010190 [Seison nebaliae]